MDSNLIKIDDLVRQRLSGGEEQERSGSWLRMQELLEQENRRKPLGMFYWRRAMTYAGLLLLLATVTAGSYEASNGFRDFGSRAGSPNSTVAMANTNTSNTPAQITTGVVNNDADANTTPGNHEVNENNTGNQRDITRSDKKNISLVTASAKETGNKSSKRALVVTTQNADIKTDNSEKNVANLTGENKQNSNGGDIIGKNANTVATPGSNPAIASTHQKSTINNSKGLVEKNANKVATPITQHTIASTHKNTMANGNNQVNSVLPTQSTAGISNNTDEIDMSNLTASVGKATSGSAISSKPTNHLAGTKNINKMPLGASVSNNRQATKNATNLPVANISNNNTKQHTNTKRTTHSISNNNTSKLALSASVANDKQNNKTSIKKQHAQKNYIVTNGVTTAIAKKTNNKKINVAKTSAHSASIVKNNPAIDKTETPSATTTASNVSGQQAGVSYAGGVGVDVAGNVYATTCFNTPSVIIGSDTIHNTSISDTSDVLIVKYSADGVPIWSKSFGGRNDDFSVDIAVAKTGHFYVCGQYNSQTMNIGGTVLRDTLPVMGGYRQGLNYLAKFDSSGNPIWAQALSKHIFINKLLTDEAENVYVTGTVDSVIVVGADTVGDSGCVNVFVAKYNAAGTAIWARFAGNTNGGAYGNALALDSCNNLWVGGGGTPMHDMYFSGDTLAMPWFGEPAFIAEYDETGNYKKSIGLAGGGDDFMGLAIDNLGHLYAAGDTKNPIVFGADTILVPTYAEALFISKYWYDSTVCFHDHSSHQNTGIPEIAAELMLFPNPASSEITLKITRDAYQALTITNCLGQVMLQENITDLQTTINLSKFSAGVYYIRLSGADVCTVKKFVKI